MIRVRNWKERLYGAGLISTLFMGYTLWLIRAELVPYNPLAVAITLLVFSTILLPVWFLLLSIVDFIIFLIQDLVKTIKEEE